MNVALNDCWEHLVEVYEDFRVGAEQVDVRAGEKESRGDPEAERLRGYAVGLREAAGKLALIEGLMHRYLEQSEGWKEYQADVLAGRAR